MNEPQRSAQNQPSPSTSTSDRESSGIPNDESRLADLHRREREARQAAEISQQRFAFLVALSRSIPASLEVQTILRTTADLLVPYLADRCCLYLRQVDGTLAPAGCAAAESAEADRSREIGRQFPTGANPLRPVQLAAVSGEPQLIREVRPEDLAAMARDEQHLARLQSLQLRSIIAIPLIAHSRIIGAILMVTTGTDRRYTETDLVMAEEIGRWVALAVENAQLYRKAGETAQPREEFLAIAAHELKTPVTSLRGFAQLILHQFGRGRPPDPDRLQRALEMIDRQAKRLSILVDQLLDLSRSDSGQLVLSPEPTDVVALVNGVAETIRIGLIRHTLNVRAAGSITATVDPPRFELVVTSLIENAVKYSPEGGPIDVDLTQPTPETIRLVVRDQGIGIPAQHLPLIFDRFYRAHSDSNYSGLGLGLFLSKQIVHLHGGKLEADRPHDGGARFAVTLPTKPPSS